MAGEWIKMRTNLWDDPRIAQIVEATESSEATVIGAMYWLWATADEHTADGFLPGLSCFSIDRKTGLKGFANALVTVGWLSANAEGVTICRFLEHNGTSAKTRVQTAKRVAEFKARGGAEQGGPPPEFDEGNAPNVTEALPRRYPAVTTPLPREEKRREEAEEESKTTTTPLSSDDDVRRCPVGLLVNLYHECMPNNPQVKVINDARKKAIGQRWREAASLECAPFGYTTRTDGLAAWRLFFETCADSDFLTGRSKPSPGKPPFIANIDFLFSPGGFAKTLENMYHREPA